MLFLCHNKLQRTHPRERLETFDDAICRTLEATGITGPSSVVPIFYIMCSVCILHRLVTVASHDSNVPKECVWVKSHKASGCDVNVVVVFPLHFNYDFFFLICTKIVCKAVTMETYF